MEHCVVGNKTVHASHRLNMFRGLIYCRICGYKAGSRGGGLLKMLTQPYPGGPASQYGIENLKLFRDGHIRHTRQMPADDFSFADATRSAECPVSNLEGNL